MFQPSSKPPSMADQWELVGPFKVFSRKNPGNREPQERPDAARDKATSSQPSTSQPARFEDDAILSRFDDSFDLDRVPPGLFASSKHQDDTFWYIDVGFRSGYTNLGWAKRQLDRRLDLPLKLDTFGIFSSPTTPIDRKSEFALTTQYIGLGRRETEWLTWNFYVGGASGSDKNHQRWLNLNLEANFNYTLIYTGLTADIYPWGVPKYRNYLDLREQLRASRPYLLTGVEVGYLRAKGWGHFAAAPVTLYSDKQKISNWLFAWLIGAGWEFPLNDRWAYNISLHYTFHLYRPEEYNGYNAIFAFRYRF